MSSITMVERDMTDLLLHVLVLDRDPGHLFKLLQRFPEPREIQNSIIVQQLETTIVLDNCLLQLAFRVEVIIGISSIPLVMGGFMLFM